MDSPTFVSSQIELASKLVCPKLPRELESQEAAANAHSSLERRIEGDLPLVLKVSEKEKTDMKTNRAQSGMRTKWMRELNDYLNTLILTAQDSHPSFVRKWKTVVCQASIIMSLVKLSVYLLGFQSGGPTIVYIYPSQQTAKLIEDFNDMHKAFVHLFEVHYSPWAQQAKLSGTGKEEEKVKATIMNIVFDIDTKATDEQLEAIKHDIIAPETIFGPDSSGSAKKVHEALKLELQQDQQINRPFAQMVSSTRVDPWLREQWEPLTKLRDTVEFDKELYPHLYEYLQFQVDGSMSPDARKRRLPSDEVAVEVEQSQGPAKKPKTRTDKAD